jgi:hypothetical protein
MTMIAANAAAGGWFRIEEERIGDLGGDSSCNSPLSLFLVMILLPGIGLMHACFVI